jgi:hypothetical protein
MVASPLRQPCAHKVWGNQFSAGSTSRLQPLAFLRTCLLAPFLLPFFFFVWWSNRCNLSLAMLFNFLFEFLEFMNFLARPGRISVKFSSNSITHLCRRRLRIAAEATAATASSSAKVTNRRLLWWNIKLHARCWPKKTKRADGKMEAPNEQRKEKSKVKKGRTAKRAAKRLFV